MPVTQEKTVFILFLGKKYIQAVVSNTATHTKWLKVIKQEQPSKSTYRPVLRSSEEKGFSFKTDCFFGGRPAKFGRKRKYKVLQAKTTGLKDTILSIYHERADSWSGTGKANILHVLAANAVYHKTCSVNLW